VKVRFAVLADYSNVTLEGKINIMGVFDIIHAPEFPALHPEMQFVMRFEADVSERGQQKDVQVRLIDGRGEKLLEMDGRITIGDAKPGALLFFNQVLTIRNVIFPSAGDYQFDIYVDGNFHHVPLKVVGPPAEYKG